MYKLSKKQRKALRASSKLPLPRKVKEHRHRITSILDGHRPRPKKIIFLRW